MLRVLWGVLLLSIVATGVVVAAGGPLAEAGLDQTADSGTTVFLDAGGSLSPDGEIVGYEWVVERPDGSTTTPACATCEQTSFVPASAGEYAVTVTVTDDSGRTASDTLYVTVVDTPSVTVSGPTRVDVNETATYQLTAEAGDQPLSTYDVLVNDQQLSTGSIADGETTEVVTRFVDGGTATVTGTVVDESGRETQDGISVTVVEPDGEGDEEGEDGSGADEGRASGGPDGPHITSITGEYDSGDTVLFKHPYHYRGCDDNHLLSGDCDAVEFPIVSNNDQGQDATLSFTRDEFWEMTNRSDVAGVSYRQVEFELKEHDDDITEDFLLSVLEDPREQGLPPEYGHTGKIDAIPHPENDPVEEELDCTETPDAEECREDGTLSWGESAEALQEDGYADDDEEAEAILESLEETTSDDGGAQQIVTTARGESPDADECGMVCGWSDEVDDQEEMAVAVLEEESTKDPSEARKEAESTAYARSDDDDDGNDQSATYEGDSSLSKTADRSWDPTSTNAGTGSSTYSVTLDGTTYTAHNSDGSHGGLGYNPFTSNGGGSGGGTNAGRGGTGGSGGTNIFGS